MDKEKLRKLRSICKMTIAVCAGILFVAFISQAYVDGKVPEIVIVLLKIFLFGCGARVLFLRLKQK